jgi:1-acyl-sn-glycerol-3-phosphate acyltransferase
MIDNNKKDNIFIAIFARIWAVWGLLSFVITFLIIFIPSMFSHFFSFKKGQDYFIAVSRVWIRFWLFLIACPLKVKGTNYFIEGETYVVTFNHNTMLDIPLSCPFLPSGNKTIGKNSFEKVPIFKWFYQRGGIMVDRKSDVSRRKSFEAMKEVIAQNVHMCIYPEGTRNKSNELLKPFYDGAFKLAVDTNKSVIPCLLFNTNKAQPNNKNMYLLPTKLQMHFLPPVSSSNKTSKQLNEEVHSLMLAYYTQNK